MLFEGRVRYKLLSSGGYVEQHKSSEVIKRIKFSIGNCNVRGLMTCIKKELLDECFDKLDVENFQFIKTNVRPYLIMQYGLE